MTMTPLLRACCLFLMLYLGLPAHLLAKDDGTDNAYTVEKEIQKFIVNTDGSYHLTVESVILINEERAIRTLAERPVIYDGEREVVDIVEAYTQKPDGRKVPVLAAQIKDQLERHYSDAQMFEKARVKIVVFPDLGVGDRIVEIYHRHCKIPLYPGYFTDMSYEEFVQVKRFSVSYDLPEAMQLQSDANGFAKINPVNSDGRKIYQWDYVGGENHRIEAGSVSYLDYGRQLSVSTFPDFAAMAKSYDLRAADKAVVTPNIEKLARQITETITEPHAKVFALYNWVRNNIRYVAVNIGVGGVVPHSSETILDNRYGDCKDHVTLMEAMLKAIGIDSTPALINAGNAYQPQKVAVGFNHIITYIPSLNLFLDSTADFVGAGYLPIVDIDKQVLLTKTGQLAHTPTNQTNHVASATVFKLEATGAGSFRNTLLVSGSDAEPTRRAYRDGKPTDLARQVEVILKNRGQRGKGTVETGDINAEGDAFQLRFQGQSENMVNLPGPVGILVAGGATDTISNSVMALAVEKERIEDFSCISGDFIEESTYELSPELMVLAIPKSVVLHTNDFEYSAEYMRKDSSVLVKRHFELHHNGAVCTTAEYKVMRPTLDRMIHDLKAQIIIQKL